MAQAAKWIGRTIEGLIVLGSITIIGASFRPKPPEGVIRLSRADWERVATAGLEFGGSDARVTVVEFIDYQCPVCARVEPMLTQLESEHPGQIRRVIRHFPIQQLHAQASIAARSVECARSEQKSYELHTLLLQRQRDFPKLDFDTLGRAVSISNVGAFEECLNGTQAKQRVEEDAALGNAMGITGTPTVIVDGMLITSLSAPRLRSLIQSRLQ